MNTPKAGELRDRVRFERRTTATDDYGNEQADWAEIVADASTRAAKLTPTRGGEQIIAGRLDGSSVFDLWVRSDTLTRQVTNGDRAVEARSGRAFNIRWAEDPTRGNEWILMQVEAGVPA